MAKKKKESLFTSLIHWLKKTLGDIWSLRYIFVITIFLILLTIAFYLFLIQKPSLKTIVPISGTLWYLSIDIDQPIHTHAVSQKLLEQITSYASTQNFTLKTGNKEQIERITVIQTQDGSILGIYPTNAYIFWDTYRENTTLPQYFTEKEIYEENNISYMWYKGYLFISESTKALYNIKRDIKIGDIQKRNILTQNIFKDIEGYIALDSAFETWKETLPKEYTAIYDNITQDLKQSGGIEIDGRYNNKGIYIQMHSPYALPYNNMNAKVPMFVTQFRDGMLQTQGTNFAYIFNQFIQSRSNQRTLYSFQTFTENLFDNTGINIPDFIELFVNRPYVLRILRNEKAYDASIFLAGKTNETEIEYLKNAFIRYIGESSPIRKAVILPDGTRGEELVIDLDAKRTEEDVQIMQYDCHKTSFKEEYEWSFVYCMNNNMTIFGTSVEAVRSLLSDASLSQKGIEVNNEYISLHPKDLEDFFKKREDIFNKNIYKILSQFTQIDIHPLSENKWNIFFR